MTDRQVLGISTLGTLSDHPRVSAFRSFLGGWYLSYFVPQLARTQPMSGADPHLDRTGENLAKYLQFIERERPKAFRAMLTRIAKTIPGLKEIRSVQAQDRRLLLEFQQMDQQLRIEREERMLIQQQANAELLRNLAHEIRNPLGGLRGAAQLLEHELPQPALREYTQVIIKEADRLQSLMDRLLVPHRVPRYELTNIHEVLERVRSLLLAESPHGVTVRRDYDTSLPELVGDREKLIQAVLNIARNAVQAMQGRGEIVFRTRAERQVTLARKRYRVAIRLQIIDNGPGIPPEIHDRIFYPLVSGREDGSGLGLTLAQTFITQHHGMIECESSPGNTCFTILLPVEGATMKSGFSN